MTREQLLTDPDQAADFVQKTQCDALAIAIGTSHGAYKFTRKPTGDILAIQRIKEIHARIPNTHLVMHGSSSVPQEWLEVIRKHGGQMKETYGVPVEEIVTGIRHGVRKVNIDTDIRLAMTGAMRQPHGREAVGVRPAQVPRRRAEGRQRTSARRATRPSAAPGRRRRSSRCRSRRWRNATARAS